MASVYWWYFRSNGLSKNDKDRELFNLIIGDNPKYGKWEDFAKLAISNCIKDVPKDDKDIEETIKPCIIDLYQKYINIPHIKEYEDLSSKFIGYILGIVIFVFLFLGISYIIYKLLCDLSKEYLGGLIFIWLVSLALLILFSVLLSNFIKDGKYDIYLQINNDPFWN